MASQYENPFPGFRVYLACLPGVAWKVGYTTNIEQRVFKDLAGVWALSMEYPSIERTWAAESWLLWQLAKKGMRRRVQHIGQECLTPGSEITAARLMLRLSVKENLNTFIFFRIGYPQTVARGELSSIAQIERMTFASNRKRDSLHRLEAA